MSTKIKAMSVVAALTVLTACGGGGDEKAVISPDGTPQPTSSEREQLINQAIDKARSDAISPPSVRVEGTPTVSVIQGASGAYDVGSVVFDFYAKNLFGVEARSRAICGIMREGGVWIFKSKPFNASYCAYLRV